MAAPTRKRGAGPSTSSSSAKATSVSLAFDPNIRSSLAHLPPSIHNALVSRDILPQSIILQLSLSGASSSSNDAEDDASNQTVFLGWSGQSSNAESTLALSASLTPLFGPSSKSAVTVNLTLLRSPPLPTATRVDLTPLTPDDWELLNQHAGAVEDNMLSQVRAVTRDAKVCIFVGRGGGQTCWFRVDSTEPQTSGSIAAEMEGERPAPRALRLTTDTEIVIAPKTRVSQAEEAAKSSHNLSNGTSSVPSRSTDAVLNARSRLKHRLFKVLPKSAKPLLSNRAFEIDGDEPIAVFQSDEDDHEIGYRETDWALVTQAFGSPSGSEWGRATLHVQPCPTADKIRPFESGSSKGKGKQEELGMGANGPSRATTTAFVLRGSNCLSHVGQREADWSSRWVWMNEALKKRLGGVAAGQTICISAPPPGSSSSPSAKIEGETGSRGLPLAIAKTALAGIDTLLDSLSLQIANSLTASRITGPGDRRSQTQVLLHGPSGVGKTSILQELSRRLVPGLTTTLYVDCSPLAEQRVSQLKASFREWRNALDWYSRAAKSNDPSIYGGAVLMLDNLDKILVAEVENLDPTRSRTVAECFVQIMTEGTGSTADGSTVVLATAESSTSMHKVLMEKHCWDATVAIKPPGKTERAEILAHLVDAKAQNSGDTLVQGAIKADGSLNYAVLSSQTEGYLPTDLVDLVDRAIYAAAVRQGTHARSASAKTVANAAVNGTAMQQPQDDHLLLTSADLAIAQENFTPISLRSLSLSTSTVSWASIGGLHETRRVLRETLEFPTRYAQIFASCPLRLRSGLLLYGYPGCGKTMLASAVAKECGANFVSVKGPELLNKYIGASEKSVRDLFERASAAKPCVLFFDEFDSIAPKRGHDSTGVTDRVVNQLLTLMDGAEGLSGVYVLAATSRPDLIDSALLRPGRLDKSLLCDMPSLEDRVDILTAVAREGNISVHESVSFKEWAEKTEGFSGADLQALLYNAHLEVVHEGIQEVQDQREANSAEDKEKDESPGKLNYVEFRIDDVDQMHGKGKTKAVENGSVEHTSHPVVPKRSGAEEAVLLRRIELALSNSRLSTRASKDGTSTSTMTSAPNGTAGAIAKDPTTVSSRSVLPSHLTKSLAGLRPSVPQSERVRLGKIYRDFAGERDGNFGNGEASKEVGGRQSLM